jgi:hypothetical protein
VTRPALCSSGRGRRLPRPPADYGSTRTVLTLESWAPWPGSASTGASIGRGGGYKAALVAGSLERGRSCATAQRRRRPRGSLRGAGVRRRAPKRDARACERRPGRCSWPGRMVAKKPKGALRLAASAGARSSVPMSATTRPTSAANLVRRPCAGFVTAGWGAPNQYAPLALKIAEAVRSMIRTSFLRL